MNFKNEKSIHLIIHPCYGKTGTTWMQTHILPQTSVLNLAKGGGLDGEKFISESLRKKQYSIFKPISYSDDISIRYKNSWSMITSYCDLLYQELLDSLEDNKNENELIAVLSDETILCYGGMEINSGLLLSVINNLESKFRKNSIDISFTINITIREQISFLKSHFCYDYINIKKQYTNFTKFIQGGLKNIQFDVFGQINYWESYLFLRSVIPKSHQINVIPYELISSNPSLFLKKYFKSIPKTHPIHNEIKHIEVRKKINSNKSIRDKNRIQDYTLISGLFESIVKYSSRLSSDFRESNPYWNSKLIKFYELLKRRNIFRSFTYNDLEITKKDLEILEELKSYYSDSNKYLNQLIPKSELIKFNYVSK